MQSYLFIYLYTIIYIYNVYICTFNEEAGDRLLDFAVRCYMFRYTQVELSVDQEISAALQPNSRFHVSFPVFRAGKKWRTTPVPEIETQQSLLLVMCKFKLNIFF